MQEDKNQSTFHRKTKMMTTGIGYADVLRIMEPGVWYAPITMSLMLADQIDPDAAIRFSITRGGSASKQRDKTPIGVDFASAVAVGRIYVVRRVLSQLSWEGYIERRDTKVDVGGGARSEYRITDLGVKRKLNGKKTSAGSAPTRRRHPTKS